MVLFFASLRSLWETLWLRFSSLRACNCALTTSSPGRASIPSEVSDPIDFQDNSRSGGGIEEDSIRIKDFSFCSSESCLYHRGIGDSV